VVPVQHLVQQLTAQVSDSYQPLILYVGSTSVYGQRDGNWVDENSLTEPDSETGKMLLAAENVLRESALNTVIVRAAGIYGPGRERMYQALQEGNYTITPTWHNRIHADDLAGALEHLALQRFMGAELDEVYIACEDTPLYGENYVRQLAHELDLDADTLLAQLPTSNEVGPRGNKRLSNARLRATGWESNSA
jgi:nucleoside-diphosphate-sugar epimerase